MRKDIHERIDQRLENILSHADNKRKVYMFVSISTIIKNVIQILIITII